MPGVPSGRGCDACRKQKKKGKPKCSRCTRLQIECVGSGVRRFKFKEQKVASSGENEIVIQLANCSRPDSQASSSKSSASPLSGFDVQRALLSETSKLTNGFVNVLEIKDLRYSVATYGLFVFDIPRRLGKSRSLDAAVNAFTVAHTTLHRPEISVDVLKSYGQAIQALRTDLQDPRHSTKLETLSAIYFIYIIQTWLQEGPEQWTNHSEGMSFILNRITAKDLKTEFEVRLFITLSATVLIDSFINPRLSLNPILWDITTSFNVPTPINRGDGTALQSVRLFSLSQCAKVVQSETPSYRETLYFYTQMRDECFKFGKYRLNFGNPSSPAFVEDEERRCHLGAAYGILLGLCIIFNSLLRAYDQGDAELMRELYWFIDESISVAEAGLDKRPLGSSWVSMCLVPAWVAAGDPLEGDIVRKEIVFKMVELYADFANPLAWLERAASCGERISDLRRRVVRGEVVKDVSPGM